MTDPILYVLLHDEKCSARGQFLQSYESRELMDFRHESYCDLATMGACRVVSYAPVTCEACKTNDGVHWHLAPKE